MVSEASAPCRRMQSHRAHPALTQFEGSGRISSMLFQRMRTFLSFGLLGSATMALVPFGCGATVRPLAQQDDRPRVPDATAERLRECVDEFGGDLSGGYYTFDVAVKVDEDGRVVEGRAPCGSRGVHADRAARHDRPGGTPQAAQATPVRVAGSCERADTGRARARRAPCARGRGDRPRRPHHRGGGPT